MRLARGLELGPRSFYCLFRGLGRIRLLALQYFKLSLCLLQRDRRCSKLSAKISDTRPSLVDLSLQLGLRCVGRGERLNRVNPARHAG